MLAVHVEITDPQPLEEIVNEYALFDVNACLTEYGEAQAPVFKLVGEESDLRQALTLVYGMEPYYIVDECIASAEVA